MAARHEREHQRAAPPVLPQGQRPTPTRSPIYRPASTASTAGRASGLPGAARPTPWRPNWQGDPVSVATTTRIRLEPARRYGVNFGPSLSAGRGDHPRRLRGTASNGNCQPSVTGHHDHGQRPHDPSCSPREGARTERYPSRRWCWRRYGCTVLAAAVRCSTGVTAGRCSRTRSARSSTCISAGSGSRQRRTRATPAGEAAGPRLPVGARKPWPYSISNPAGGAQMPVNLGRCPSRGQLRDGRPRSAANNAQANTTEQSTKATR
jgi:hypothetical protein